MHAYRYDLKIHITILVAVVAVASGQINGTLSTSDGNYTFSWTITNGQINGEIIINDISVGRWAAVGFSDNKLMPLTDVIIGGNNGAGQSFVEDRWITDGRTPDNVVYDDSQDISNTSAAYDNDVLTISFSRLLKTNDYTQDISIEDRCVYVLWAYGGMVGNFSTTPVTDLTGHTANGVFTQQLCSGCTSIVMSLGVLLLGALIATFATY